MICLKKGFILYACPVKRYNNTSIERLKLVDFYDSALDRVIYSRRRTSSVEPLIKHIESTFRIDPVPARGLENVRGIILLIVLLYQILLFITTTRYQRMIIREKYQVHDRLLISLFVTNDWMIILKLIMTRPQLNKNK
jgi:hypothetical protein